MIYTSKSLEGHSHHAGYCGGIHWLSAVGGAGVLSIRIVRHSSFLPSI